jgi:hypothetical protein
MGLGGVIAKNRRTLRRKLIVTPFPPGIEFFLPGRVPKVQTQTPVLRSDAKRNTGIDSNTEAWLVSITRSDFGTLLRS